MPLANSTSGPYRLGLKEHLYVSVMEGDVGRYCRITRLHSYVDHGLKVFTIFPQGRPLLTIFFAFHSLLFPPSIIILCFGYDEFRSKTTE